MTEKRYTVGKELKVVDDNILKGNFYVCTDRAEALKLADKLNEFHNENVRLVKENEQLKQTMHEVAELLSEEVDLFSDKATEHDINAYVELREFDNKDAYYMAISTKKAIRMLKEYEE